MTTTMDIETTAVLPPGTDLAPYMAQPLEEYRPRIVMTGEEAAAIDKQLRDMMRGVLTDGVDFGVIPGTGTKPSLYKPGAEKLLQWFGFGNTNERIETERDDDGKRLGVTYRCTVTKSMPDGRVVAVATCEGYAGYDEDRFYVSAEDARAKAEAKEREWARKDKRDPIPSKWTSAVEYRAPWNSVIKMAQKRAMVGAALGATSASTLFTQDLEDTHAGPAADPFTIAADAALRALPLDVRNALDAWWKARKWPTPDRWTPEQLVAALQTAGYLTARRESAQQAAREARQPAHSRQAEPEPEAPVVVTPDSQTETAEVAEQGPGEAEWVRAFAARLGDATTDADITARRLEVTRAAVVQKIISGDTANELFADIKRRGGQIADPKRAAA